MILKKSFNSVKKRKSKTRNTGDVENARKIFYSKKNKNLYFLLKKRYDWMNSYIKGDQYGIEVGSGSGLSKEFIKSKNYLITDFTDKEWLDKKMIDALNTNLVSNSFDFVIASNMIHHVPYPMLFFKEMDRILKPGGHMIIQDVNCSLMLKLLLVLMNHEGYDSTVDVFDKRKICTDPQDLWAGNNSIPNLLFDNEKKFEKEVNQFKVIFHNYSEFLTFINSGGVVSKIFYLPLPNFFLKLFYFIDTILCKLAPSFFALQRQIVLKKS